MRRARRLPPTRHRTPSPSAPLVKPFVAALVLVLAALVVGVGLLSQCCVDPVRVPADRPALDLVRTDDLSE